MPRHVIRAAHEHLIRDAHGSPRGLKVTKCIVIELLTRMGVPGTSYGMSPDVPGPPGRLGVSGHLIDVGKGTRQTTYETLGEGLAWGSLVDRSR